LPARPGGADLAEIMSARPLGHQPSRVWFSPPSTGLSAGGSAFAPACSSLWCLAQHLAIGNRSVHSMRRLGAWQATRPRPGRKSRGRLRVLRYQDWAGNVWTT
jgi:hypothetical protein